MDHGTIEQPALQQSALVVEKRRAEDQLLRLEWNSGGSVCDLLLDQKHLVSVERIDVVRPLGCEIVRYECAHATLLDILWRRSSTSCGH